MCGADSRERTHSQSPQGVDLQRAKERERRGRGEGEERGRERDEWFEWYESVCERSDSEVQVCIQTDSRKEEEEDEKEEEEEEKT